MAMVVWRVCMQWRRLVRVMCSRCAAILKTSFTWRRYDRVVCMCVFNRCVFKECRVVVVGLDSIVYYIRVSSFKTYCSYGVDCSLNDCCLIKADRFTKRRSLSVESKCIL